MTCAITRRGPDDEGIFHQDGVGLGHRRLSIIDLSPLGHQPMSFQDLVIVFNGEIYNYREVQGELIKKGYQFESSSDTEVVLKAFHCWGPACVKRFIGMFAIAVYDKTEKALYLIRDRVGVKPLYFYHKEGRVAFASELRSLKHYLTDTEKKQINPQALSQFLSVGYIGNGNSIISAVQKVPQGHFLKFVNEKVEVHQYWNVQFKENLSWLDRKESEILDELEDIIISAFKYRMVADVPIGVFLSAGVDSSLVTAILSRHFGQLKTFTIGYKEGELDESADARKIADYLGTIHTEGYLNATKAFEILKNFYDIYDEPHGDYSCFPTAYVSELAKEAGVKVVLSADAGDELFGGYTRYVEYMQRWQQIQRFSRPARTAAGIGVKAISAVLPGARGERFSRFGDILEKEQFIHFYQTIIRSSSVRELKSIFPQYGEPLNKNIHTDVLNAMSEWDFSHYMVDDILMKVDRATMYHSIEGREPFLDHRLIEFAAQLPLQYKVKDGQTKYILKKLLGRYLPLELYNLPKRGFGAPVHIWVKEYFRDHLAELFEDSDIPFFDKGVLMQMVRQYQQGKPVNHVLLWNLFSFSLWYTKWIKQD